MPPGGRFVSEAGFRPSGPCFIEVLVKTKRNGCFYLRHWESLAPSPPAYESAQEGTGHFLMRAFNLDDHRCHTIAEEQQFMDFTLPTLSAD